MVNTVRKSTYMSYFQNQHGKEMLTIACACRTPGHSKIKTNRSFLVSEPYPTNEQIIERFAGSGWIIDPVGGDHKCPECANRIKLALTSHTNTAKSSKQDIPMPSEAPAQSIDRAATHLVTSDMPPRDPPIKAITKALASAYDLDAQCYMPGCSDGTVAKESGATIEQVAIHRMRAWGPAIDPEAEKIKGDTAKLRSEWNAHCASFETRLLALEDRAKKI